jgi:UDP-2,4-diacetamido-2,4,6-trideoxy-beta-L-altropyranose hydrolase
MEVALRVDASATIGLGHLQRCLALAHALRALAVGTVFVTRDLGLDSAARIAAEGFAVRVLPAPLPGMDPSELGALPPHAAWAGVPVLQDAAETVAALRTGRGSMPDWVVVDHYALDGVWHSAVAKASGTRLAVIDDLADRSLQADLVIDQNLADPDVRTKYRTHVDPGTALLGGPRYALLGPTYADAPRCSLHDTVRSIGVFLGGTDPAGLSELVLRACRENAGFAGAVELVTTRANPRHAALRALAERWPHTTVLLDLHDLAEFFARHDLQVGAGGGATWERCCVGAPTLALVAAANQLAVIPQLVHQGAVAALPPGVVPTAEAVGRELLKLLADAPRRRALGERARTLVDGLGARRVALRLAANLLLVRRTRAADSTRMHRWRNDPANRIVSRTTSSITLDEHQEWLARALADSKRLLLVGEVGPSAVGVIRFDRLDDNALEVSLYLDPMLHGLGLGTALLVAGENAAREWAGLGLRFEATVLDGSTGSRRLFESAGYRFDGTRGHKPTSAANTGVHSAKVPAP